MPSRVPTLVFVAALALIAGGSATPAGAQPRRYYLAEGATGALFDFDLALFNPGEITAPVTLRFLREHQAEVRLATSLEPGQRRTIRVDDLPGLGNELGLATIVESDQGHPLVVGRLLSWGEGRYGSHGGAAVEAPAPRWYFAEGHQGFFDTYVLLLNPGTTDTAVSLTFLREGAAPVTHEAVVPAGRRFTFWAGSEPSLHGHAFSVVVAASAPIVAERAMYFGTRRFWEDGHVTSGAPAPSTRLVLPEGVTGSWFDTYVLIGNPGDRAARVEVRAQTGTGTEVVRYVDVPALERRTILLDGLARELADTASAVLLTSDVPVVAERVTYWPGAAGTWRGSHASSGLPRLARRWAVALVRRGGHAAAESYVLVSNPGPEPQDVRFTFVTGTGARHAMQERVPAHSRHTVAVPHIGDGPDASDVSVIVEASTSGIAVESVIYWNVGDEWWSAGAAMAGVALPADGLPDAVVAGLARVEQRRVALAGTWSTTGDGPAVVSAWLRQRIALPEVWHGVPGAVVIRARRPVPSAADGYLRLWVNGWRVPDVALATVGPAWQTTVVSIPADRLLAGENELELLQVGGDEIEFATASEARVWESCVWDEPTSAWRCTTPTTGGVVAADLIAWPSAASAPAVADLFEVERFALASWVYAYPHLGIGPYYVDPFDAADIADLRALVTLLRVEGDPYATARHLLSFVHHALIARVRNDTQDAWRVLAHDAGGLCSGHAQSFVALAALAGIDGRVVGLWVGDEGQEAGHILAELWIDDEWVAFDPMTNVTLEHAPWSGPRRRYSVADIAAAASRLGPETIAAFEGLAPANARGPALEDVYLDPVGGRSWISYFAGTYYVDVGVNRLPYYSSHHPPE